MIWIFMGFVVGFAISASSFRGFLFDRDEWVFAWFCCTISGLIVALLELAVYLYA